MLSALGAIAGMGMGIGSSFFGQGSKVKLTAPNEPVLQKEYPKYMEFAKSQLPAATELTGGINQANLDQLTSMWKKIAPEYQSMTAGITKNLLSELKGEIPKDVQESILASTAAQAAGGGYGFGGSMKTNLSARDLGLTSYNIAQQGINSTMQWLGQLKSNFMPQQQFVQSFIPDPMQQYQIANANYWRGYEDYLIPQAIYSAQPDPKMAALSKSLSGMGGIMGGAGMMGMMGS